MTDRERAQAEHQTKFDVVLSELGLTHPEFAILLCLYYSINNTPEDLSIVAVGEYNDCDSRNRISEADTRHALLDCFAKGWVQVLDESSIRKIEDDLRNRGVLGPVYGFPKIGGVDFTTTGADLWQRYWERCHTEKRPIWTYINVIREKSSNYYPTLAKAQQTIDDFKNREGIVSVSEPSAIGPWRGFWWQRFPEGYRVDIEERYQWRGGSIKEDTEDHHGNSFDPEPSLKPQLQKILDCHTMSQLEWWLCSEVASSRYLSSADSLCRVPPSDPVEMKKLTKLNAGRR